MKLLICGSRKANDLTLALARQAAERAIYLGWHIVVGDAAGVDAEVVSTCYRMADIDKFMIYGVSRYPRNWPDDGMVGVEVNYTQVKCPEGMTWKQKFLHRDRVMVDVSDRVFAVWNGESGGTKYAYEYARRMGKIADIRDFSKKVQE